MTDKGKKGKLKKEELAVLVSVVAAAVVIVQKFLADNDLLLLPSQTMALEASVRATSLALAKLQTMFSVAEVISIEALMEDEDEEVEKIGARDERNRREPWFRRFIATIEDDGTWRDNLRMSRVSFATLVAHVRQSLRPSTVSVETKVGAALFRLAHGASFRDVGRRFGIPSGAASEAFHEFCRVLESDFDHHRFGDLVSPEGLHAIVDGFDALNMPNCCGIIGYTRFLLQNLVSDSTEMKDYKDPQGRHSVIMQALVDSSGRFLDISVGWPGSFTPSSILPGTLLYTYVESGELLQGHPANLLNNILMPQYIIGNSSCPLYPWLLTPYPKEGLGAPSGGLTPVQELFNSVHEYARNPIYRAFGVLKTQWQLLNLHHQPDGLDSLSHIVSAACVLHNFLIRNGEPMPDVKEIVDNDFPEACQTNEFAESIRDALASHISMVVQL